MNPPSSSCFFNKNLLVCIITINKIHFKIIPILKTEGEFQIPVVWEQVRTVIDGIDIIKLIDADDNFR